ncbi:hypothetical protein [Microbacterium sp. P01]|uniref:hypothetical protein n=1 Tax=unclassified Microbacterium TaxID=2609290 RepID=UPI0036726F1D
MTEHLPVQTTSPNTLTVGDPAYSLLAFVAGTLVQVGTRATTYMSSLALAPAASTSAAVTS